MTLFSEITKAYYIDGVGTETEIDALNLWRYNLYTKDAVTPIFYTNFIQESNRMTGYEPGRAILNGSYVSATITSPTVISGCRATTWGAGGNVAWPTALLSDVQDKGTIFFNWTPNYSGSPQSDVSLFEIETPKVNIRHASSGELTFELAGLRTISAPVTAVEGTEIRIKVEWTLDDSPNNFVKLYADDSLIAIQSSFANETRGSTAASYITKFAEANAKGECGKVGPLYIYNVGAFVSAPIMTLEGITMTLEGTDMILI